MAPDNRPLAIKEILVKYGWPSKKDRKYKVFFGRFNGGDFNKVGLFNDFKLEVDRDLQVIHLVIRNHLTNNINKNISWSFEQLENRLNMKLKYLALIPVSKKIYFGKTYFKYHNLKLYKLKSFDKFLELIEDGTISVNMKISFYTSKEKYGKIQDKGTTFEIKEKDLEKLFTRIDISNI